MSNKETNLKKMAFFDHEGSGDDEEKNLLKNSKNVIYSIKTNN